LNTTDEISLLQPIAADKDFDNEQAAADWYVLLWSHSQNGFHIERHRDMLASNRRAYAQDRRMDFVPIFVGTHDFCCRMADRLRNTVRHREIERQTSRAIQTARGRLR
jgi:hypothetical protein